MDKYVVESIEIPKLGGEYQTDYRNITFRSLNGAASIRVTCILSGNDLHSNDEVQIELIKSSIESRVSELESQHWNFNHHYKCVSDTSDGSRLSATFYKDKVEVNGKLVKWYSELMISIPYSESPVLGEDYSFFYKKVKSDVESNSPNLADSYVKSRQNIIPGAGKIVY